VALHAHLVETGRLRPDAAQDAALLELARVYEGLGRVGAAPAPHGPGRCREAGLGVYLYGHVGTGKTLLLDLFLASVREGLPRLRVHRAHLHDFLCAVHAELHRKKLMGTENAEDCAGEPPAADGARVGADGCSPFFAALPSRWWLLGEEDDRGRRRTGMAACLVHANRNGRTATSVERLGRALAARLDVLCFDEVAITSIQDCVVLGPLMRELCRRGVAVVATSNRAPVELYAGGLNRHVHLPPLVEALHSHCCLHRIASDVDHRVRLASCEGPATAGTFLWSCPAGSPESVAFLDSWWQRAAGTPASEALVRQEEVGYGRSLPVLQSPCRSCARFRFDELCASALGASDFAKLCERFPALLVADVPRLRAGAHSEAQRWIWLLDCCYERHTRLVVTTVATGPEDIVDLSSVAEVGLGGGRSLQEVSFAVARASSRLQEMQTGAFQRASAERRAGSVAQ